MRTFLTAFLLGWCSLCPAAADPPEKRIHRDQPCVGVPAITPHEIAMVVRANRHRLQECYREALKQKPGLSGGLTARFLLTDEGFRVQIAQSTLDHPPFLECVIKALRRFDFPPLRYRIGQRVKVNFPFEFRPDNPDNRPDPLRVHYREGRVPLVESGEKSLTVTLPPGAKKALAAAHPGYRLIQEKDLIASGSPGRVPRPFAAVSNFDRFGGDDLALALVHRQVPDRWRLVVLHHHPGGYRPVTVTDSGSIRSAFERKTGRQPAFFITREARCFCERRCLAVASDVGLSYEFEWNGKNYRGRLVDYRAPTGR